VNPPESLSLRPMETSDVDAVLALERQTAHAPHWSPEDYLAITTGQPDLPLQRIALVAEFGASLVGFAVLRCLAIPGGSEAELESIAVAAGQRRRGIAGKLLTSLIEVARDRGAQSIDLEVRSSNAEAIRLYLRAGFRETGMRPRYYREPDEDALLMQITL
jgi:ribosomal-protein-alanine acetyltransferase